MDLGDRRRRRGRGPLRRPGGAGAARADGGGALTRHRLLATALLATVVTSCDGGTVDLASDSCAAVTRPQLQEGSHLLGDTEPPVPYSSSPPTSGWHRSGRPPEPGAYAEELAGPDQVSWLEAGGVVLAYDPALDGATVRALAELTTEVEELVVTPYSGALERPVVLTAWGALQACDDVDVAAVRAFVDAYAESVEEG